MGEFIDEKTGGVNMGALSQYNGKTEFENFKMIMEVLRVKAKLYEETQKVRLVFPKDSK